jgi:hypothetical protein
VVIVEHELLAVVALEHLFRPSSPGLWMRDVESSEEGWHVAFAALVVRIEPNGRFVTRKARGARVN